MVRFSANLGFLWQDRSLCDGIRAAKAAGFSAVECHWPYGVDVDEFREALQETGLPCLGLNTRIGSAEAGDFGLAALPGRQQEARDAIEEAVSYASRVGVQNVHVMAGKVERSQASEEAFRSNLAYAAEQARREGIGILIEPINQRDVPGYYLSTIEDAAERISAVGVGNVKIMFDCYHTQIMQGDLTRRLRDFAPMIGHVQIAAVPDRGEPDSGEVNYPDLLSTLYAGGYEGFVGAEYRPRGATGDGLGWMSAYR